MLVTRFGKEIVRKSDEVAGLGQVGFEGAGEGGGQRQLKPCRLGAGEMAVFARALLQCVGSFADNESDAKNGGGPWRSRLVR
jgi:hypothetical protein